MKRSPSCCKVPAKPSGITSAIELLRVAGHELLHIALEPADARGTGELQRRLWEAASKCKFDIAPQVGALMGKLKGVRFEEAVDELGIS